MGGSNGQLALVWDRPSSRSRYEAWRRTDAGRKIFALFERFALEMAARGQRFGFRLIAERVRWEVLTTWDWDDFKLNDHYTPFIARELAEKHSVLRDLVEFRTRGCVEH